jgi:DNA topoisomerase 1
MEINITLDVQGATVEEVQWLAGLLAAQRTAPAPITVEAETATPTTEADEEKSAPKKAAAKKATPKKATPKKATPKKADPEPTPEPEPVADETDGATVEDETVTPEADLLAVAVARATELIGAGEQDAIKTALKTAGARRVGLLKGDQIQAFLDALPWEA